MFPDTTYISLGISPDADAIVVQPVIPDGYSRACFACPISIAELDSRGRAEAIDKIGCITLASMRAYFAVTNVYADQLIPTRGKPLAVHLPDHSGSKRSLHLRIQALNGDQSLVIRRFDNELATGHDTPAVMLEPLMAIGPEAVADFLGETLLAELKALHPDVFAPFPRLSACFSG